MLEVLDVLELVGRDQPGAERPEGGAALALHPLAAALRLEVALGDVVADAVAGHIGQRLGFSET